LPPIPVQPACSLHLFQFAADLGHAIANLPAVGFDLRLARAAKEAETATLAFEVGPAPDQAPCLVVQMGQFDLQPALRRRRPLSKNLEDQPGPVDHLGLGDFLEALLLDWRQSGIDDQEARFMLLHHFRNGFGLSLSEQGRRACRPQPESFTADDLNPDGFGQAFCFIEPRFG